MGLDHGLKQEIYVKNWSYETKENGGKPKHEVVYNGKKIDAYAILMELFTWRKENHFHKWFVDNVQGGTDECQDSHVSGRNLLELYEVCNKVLLIMNGAIKDDNIRKDFPENPDYFEFKEDINEHIHGLLPRQAGFFFGNSSMVYDKWYYDSILDFIEGIDKLKKLCKYDDLSDFSYTYWSSW